MLLELKRLEQFRVSLESGSTSLISLKRVLGTGDNEMNAKRDIYENGRCLWIRTSLMVD